MAQDGGVVNNNLSTLFSELNRLGESGDYDRALKVVNKILQESADDEKAFHCKVVCLIQLSQFEEALAFLRKNAKLGSGLVFEKAYCEYRLNRTEDALKTIKSVPNPDDRVRELLGQVLYRLENYTECFSVYKDLLKNTQDDFEEERETNLSAAVAALEIWGDGCEEKLPLREDTYELCYNAACVLLGRHQYTAAVEKFKQAEALCRKAHEDDADANAEDCEAELGTIWVQMGYALQKLGQFDGAMKLYNQVMKHRQSDVALAAVASNNIITINKDQNVFDSKKKIKVATAEGLKQKLVSDQRRTIAMNECLLYMYMGQGDHCRRLAQVLRTSYPNCDTPSLIEAAQCLREKNSGKAIECLQSQVDNEKIDVLHMKLALAQLFLSQEHIYNACDVLRSLGDFSYTPGVVSTLVTLYSSQEDKESAADVLSKAIDWYHANDPKSVHLPTLIRASANFHLHLGSPQVAAQMLEELHRQNPSDLKTLAQLISAYAKFDPSRAHAVSKQLPSVDTLAKDIDVDALEASLSLLSSKYVKKSTTSGGKVEPSPRPGQPPAGRTDVEVSAKRKNKKKKKKVLPKNYDPNATPDPERWLPLRERSYYRGKRKNRKREIGKGTQGVAQASSELDASKSTSSPPNSQISSPKSGTSSTTTAAAQQPSTSATTPNQSGAGPRQQKPQAAKQRPGGGGGKKKKGVKW